MSDALQLERGSWYAWHLFPGYGQPFLPYSSPIWIEDVHPEKSGRSILRLRLIDAGYAEGVQDFTRRLRILARRQNHLVTELLDDDGSGGRHAVIGRIGRTWLEQHVSVRGPEVEMSDAEDLGQRRVDDYLDRLFRGVRY